MTEPTAPNVAPTPARSPVLNSSTLIMGPTRSGKSSLLATFAEWVWLNYKLITVYAALDDGGFPTQIQALINRGIILCWRPKTRSGEGLTHETLQRMAQGWLPKKMDPKTGVVDPNVEMVPPVTAAYVMKCPKGHVIKTVVSQNQLTPAKCPGVAGDPCGLMVDLRTAKIETVVKRTRGFEKIGAYMFDGLTSATQWGLDDLSRRDLGGEKSALGGSIVSGNLTFGQNNRAQVGFVQNRAQQLGSASNSIPYLVVPPVWTALTQEGSDEGGLRVRGPLLAGVAKVAVAPQWFGDVLETAVTSRDQKRYRTLYLQSFVDVDGVRHLCGIRSYPGLLPSVLEDEDTDDPAQARFQNFNLGHFYMLREEAAKTLEAEYAQKYADAPGLTEGIITFGEEGQTAPPDTGVGAPLTSAPGPTAGLAPGMPGSPSAPPPAAIAPNPPRPMAPNPPKKGPQMPQMPVGAAQPPAQPGTSPAPSTAAPPAATEAASVGTTASPAAPPASTIPPATQATPVIGPPVRSAVPPPPGRKRAPAAKQDPPMARPTEAAPADPAPPAPTTSGDAGSNPAPGQ